MTQQSQKYLQITHYHPYTICKQEQNVGIYNHAELSLHALKNLTLEIEIPQTGFKGYPSIFHSF